MCGFGDLLLFAFVVFLFFFLQGYLLGNQSIQAVHSGNSCFKCIVCSATAESGEGAITKTLLSSFILAAVLVRSQRSRELQFLSSYNLFGRVIKESTCLANKAF